MAIYDSNETEVELKKTTVQRLVRDYDGRQLPHFAGANERIIKGDKKAHTNISVVSFEQMCGWDRSTLMATAGAAARDLVPMEEQMPKPWSRKMRMVITVGIEKVEDPEEAK
jgi:hypothetical protein